MEKYLYNFDQAMRSGGNPMLVISFTILIVALIIVVCMGAVLVCAWLFSITGPGILLAVPVLALIRVGYAVWTGK